MAKKAVGTTRTGVGKNFSRVIKMVKSKETGAYFFKEEIVHIDKVDEFLKQKEDE